MFVDAPHNVAGSWPSETHDEASSGRRELGWWRASEQNTRPSRSLRAIGADESVATIRHACESHGAFDGLLAFSQGCAAGALAIAELGNKCVVPDGFCVLAAGFLPADETLRARIEKQAPLPQRALVVSGTNDALVERERTDALGKCFQIYEAFYHDGGHGIPTTSDFRSHVRSFIESRST